MAIRFYIAVSWSAPSKSNDALITEALTKWDVTIEDNAILLG
jgi:hypothetical protein